MAITNALVVDDSRLARLTLTKLLEKRRIDVEKVSSAREAFETLKSIRPDVILMDVTMPDIDGLEATRMITNNPETSQIPVIMCTAEDTSEARDRALACGATAFLTKPAGDENLDRVLEEISQQLADSENVPQESEIQPEAANEPITPPAATTPTLAAATPPPEPAFKDLIPRIEQIAKEAARSAAEDVARKAAESVARELVEAQREELEAMASESATKIARQAALDVCEATQKQNSGTLDSDLVREVAESVAGEIAQREAAQITADFGSAMRREFEEQIENLLASDSLKKRIAASVSKPVVKGPDPAALQKLAAEVAERTSETIVRELTGELARGEARETATSIVQEHLRELRPDKSSGKDAKRARNLALLALAASIVAIAGAGATLYTTFSSYFL